MKEYFVRDLKSNQEFISFFMVKSIEVRVGTNKKQYLDMNLSDATGEVNAKKWDLAEAELPALSAIKEGDIVKVKAQVSEWNGQTQLRVLKVRKSNETDNLEMEDFIKAAPEASEDMYAYIMARAEEIADDDFRKLATYLLEKNKARLMYYPAAAKNHHAEYGGLLWHVKRMLMSGIALSEIYDFLSKDLIVTGVIIHDIEKLTEIEANENGVSTGYSVKGQLLGHITQGVTLIDEVCKELGIPDEKAMILEHMVLSHHYEPDFGSPRRPMFPEAELLHYLDIMDARMYDMEEAISNLAPGAFSERVRTLDGRKIYRPSFMPYYPEREPEEE
ncbi:MAG: HD domain-containing protein [Firmicutes bacterium]|nr:HD domain-containing protein [Bacillota bacterium]